VDEIIVRWIDKKSTITITFGQIQNAGR